MDDEAAMSADGLVEMMCAWSDTPSIYFHRAYPKFAELQEQAAKDYDCVGNEGALWVFVELAQTIEANRHGR